MPDAVPTTVNFTEKNFSQPCNTVQKLTFRQARRYRISLYTALQQELYEDGCYLTAKHFKELRKKENRLYAQMDIIRRVSEDRELLLEFVDNMRIAEQTIRLDKHCGNLTFARLLYQSILLLEKYSYYYQWLIDELYDIFAKYLLKMHNTDYATKEVIARFILKYGNSMLHSGKAENLTKATTVLPHALDLCQSETWLSNPKEKIRSECLETLCQAISECLANVYLLKSREPGITHKSSFYWNHKALVAVAKAGVACNKLLFFKALLTKIEIFITVGQYMRALRELCEIEPKLMPLEGIEYIDTQCLYLKQIGICYNNLRLYKKALVALSNGIVMCRKRNFYYPEGELLMEIARTLYFEDEKLKSFLAFNMAKRHFDTTGNSQNVKKINYYLAKSKANAIFPHFMQLLKSSKYCNFYKLRHWKNGCVKFWESNRVEEDAAQELLGLISMHSAPTLHRLYGLIINDEDNCFKNSEEKELAEIDANANDFDEDFGEFEEEMSEEMPESQEEEGMEKEFELLEKNTEKTLKKHKSSKKISVANIPSPDVRKSDFKIRHVHRVSKSDSIECLLTEI